MVKSRHFIHKTGSFQIVLTILETQFYAGYSLYDKIIADVSNFCNLFWNITAMPEKAQTFFFNIRHDISKKREEPFGHSHR